MIHGESLLQPIERQFLIDTLPPHSWLLEIGTWHGATTAEILDRRLDVRALCCETFSGGLRNDEYSDPAYGSLWANYRARRERMILVLTDASMLVLFGLRPFAAVALVDGDHRTKSVACDLRSAARLTLADGQILAHDYCSGPKDFDGIREAVDEFCKTTEWHIIRTFALSAILERTNKP